MTDKICPVTWSVLEHAYEKRIADLRAAMDVAHYQAGNLAVSRRVIEQALIFDREAEGKPTAKLKFWLEYAKSTNKALVSEAVAAERKRCVEIVRKHGISPFPIDDPNPNAEEINATLQNITAAIREGGEHG
ncbi:MULTISPECIES: hypothetical protein [Asaia]|uniref:hypothetical protein n=1 Tax=Asaia TaxID=91914 RepID=UPI002FC28386